MSGLSKNPGRQISVFLSCADVLFDDLPNKSTIFSRIQDMPVSARTIKRRITDIAKDVNKRQTIAFKTANVFSVTLDESIDIINNPRLAVFARYCCGDGEVHEEFCWLNTGKLFNFQPYFQDTKHPYSKNATQIT